DNVMGNYVRHHSGRGNVEDELDRCFDFVNRMTAGTGMKNVFVCSNHSHGHLSRWMNECDPRKDPENCVFWAKTFQAMCAAARMGQHGIEELDPFTYWGKQLLSNPGNAVFLGANDSYMRYGIEFGLHGDKGPNGSRGTMKSFKALGVKTV